MKERQSSKYIKPTRLHRPVPLDACRVLKILLVRKNIELKEVMHGSSNARRLFKNAVQQGRSEGRGEAYHLGYVEPLSDARTMLAGFFNGLLDFTISFALTHRTISMKYSLARVTRKGDRYEHHPIDTVFRALEPTGSADSDYALRTSRLCRNLRVRTDRDDLPASPQ